MFIFHHSLAVETPGKYKCDFLQVTNQCFENSEKRENNSSEKWFTDPLRCSF